MAFPFDTILDVLRAGAATISGTTTAARAFLVDPTSGVKSRVSIFGDLRIAETVRVVGSGFAGTSLDTNFWSTSLAAAGSSTVATGYNRLQTGTTANGAASVETVRPARYITTVPNGFRSVIQCTTAGTANNVRRWGAFDANNGFFYQLSGTTFSVVTRKDGVDTVINSGSFNGASTTYALDTNSHVFEITWSHQRVLYTIDDVLVHSIEAATTTLASSLAFKCTASNTNSGGSTTNVVMDIRVMFISRLGSAAPRPVWRNIATNTTTVCKMAPGSLSTLVVDNKGNLGGTVTIYDNTVASGSLILDLTVPANTTTSFTFNLDFYTGLTIVTSGFQTQSSLVVYD